MPADITEEQIELALRARYTQAIEEISIILGDVTEACIDPRRAQVLASNAVNEALKNVEGK